MTITYSGDVEGTEIIDATANAASPAQVDLRTLASGSNTITPPTGGATAKSVTIKPPVGNVVTITLKGVTGDTGFLLSPTEPTTLALATGTTAFDLTCSATLTGIRFYWT
jgi:hypothetical protein